MFRYFLRLLFRKACLYERFNLFDEIYKTESKLVNRKIVHQHYYINVDGTKKPVCKLCKKDVPEATDIEGLFCPDCYDRVNHEWKKMFRIGLKD